METDKTNSSKPKQKTRFSSWKKINFSKYLKDFKLSFLYWLLTLIATVVLFELPIKKFLNHLLIDPLLAFCPQDLSADLVFISFFFLSILFFVRQLYKHKFPTINSLLFGITLIFLYFLFFKASNYYTFYHFSLGLIKNFTFATIFLLGGLLLVFSYKSYLKPLKKESSMYSLLDDYPSIENYKDIYGRTGYAASIAKHIESTSSDVSFAISIIGDWGSGKSDFLTRLKSALKNDEENILFDFNPWRVNKADAIIEEFFNALSSQLKPYNQSIANTINDYSNRILKTASETHFKFLNVFIRSWFEEGDIQERYNTINESIKATSKRIIIFIDDVDRLTGKEVMEVLRIIRNTANFANTFFVVGIDQNYTVKVLKNTEDYANEEEYLKKVFQLTITLPAFKKEAFASEIEKYLFTEDLERNDHENLKLALTKFGEDTSNAFSELFPNLDYESLLGNMLDTIRDLKRFCNSFKIAFNILKDEVDLHDLIILELIRNKNIKIYNGIRDKRILNWTQESPDSFILDEKKWNELEDEIPESDKQNLKNAVEYLIRDESYKNQRKFNLKHNFYLYFSYQLFEQISMKEFNQTLEKEADEITSTFKNWIEDGNENELLKVVSYIGDMKDADELKKISIVLLRLSNKDNRWFNEANNLLYKNWLWNNEKYFKKDDNKHKQFLYNLFGEESISFYVRAKLANKFLIGLNSPQTPFFNKKELLDIIYSLFDKYLKSDQTDPLTNINFYRLNDILSEDPKLFIAPKRIKDIKIIC